MILEASLFNTPIDFFKSDDVPTILVKIKDGKVEHQLPNWSGDTWTPYGSWSSYLNKEYVKNRTDGATVGSHTYSKHCVLIHESDDPNVPVGTKYGSACSADIVAKNCPENATIVNGLCECDSGFELDNGLCQPANSTSGSSDEDPVSSAVEPEKPKLLLWVGVVGLAALALLAKR